MTHSFALRVYYEDTDLAGIVYYANYLKFIERARTEFVRERGVDQAALKAAEGIVFAVRHVEADYLAPGEVRRRAGRRDQRRGDHGARTGAAPGGHARRRGCCSRPG